MKKQILLSLSILLLCFSAISAQEIPKTISGGVVNGKAISLPKPEYPSAARAVGACGAVNVQVLIDEQGLVDSAQAVSGHPLLKEASAKAAQQAKFSQTRLSGQPVKVSGIIVYVFTCNDKEESSDLKETGNSDDPPLTLLGTAKESQSTNDSSKTIIGGIVNGKALSLPKPEYPTAAREAGANGNVKVEIIIDEGGNVISAKSVSGHHLLKQVSEQAALKARFSPTLLAGQPVKVSGSIVYNFGDFSSKKGFEEETKILGLGAIFTFFNPMIESGEGLQAIIEDTSKEFPQFSEDLKTLKSLNKNTPKSERIKSIDKSFLSIKDKLKTSEKWQMEMGNHFGKLMMMFKKSEVEEIDETDLRTELLKIRDLIFSAPNDFPVEVLDKFKEVAKFADEQKLAEPDNKGKVFEATYNLIQTISPDN
jgi:TonB family protein